MNDFSWYEAGHVALVTGASQGLGYEVAAALSGRGVRVIIDARHAAALSDAAERISRLGGEVIAVPGDVANREHRDQLIAAARRFGRLDLLVNNASTLGAVPLRALAELEPEQIRLAFDVNAFAPIELIRAALPLLCESELATIVNISSDAAVQAYAGWSAYGASKAALEVFSAILAQELADTSIRVAVVDPGDMNTQMHRDALPDADPHDLREPRACAAELLGRIAQMRAPFERIRLAVGVPA